MPLFGTLIWLLKTFYNFLQSLSSYSMHFFSFFSQNHILLTCSYYFTKAYQFRVYLLLRFAILLVWFANSLVSCEFDTINKILDVGCLREIQGERMGDSVRGDWKESKKVFLENFGLFCNFLPPKAVANEGSKRWRNGGQQGSPLPNSENLERERSRKKRKSKEEKIWKKRKKNAFHTRAKQHHFAWEGSVCFGFPTQSSRV